MKRVVISAGEASGDAYGAALTRELRAILPDVDVAGAGGKRMSAEGVALLADSSHWGAISIMQSLRVLPRVRKGYGALKRALASGQPGLFVPIDFGYVNIRLARYARANGWKVLYFVPPGSWRRDRQGRDLPAVTDAIVTPFPWSAEILRGMGADAHWFGHPIKQLLHDVPGEHPDRQGLAVLPGSRSHEIMMNLPVLAVGLRDLPETLDFALAPTADSATIARMWEGISGRKNDRFHTSGAGGVLSGARAAVVCSGTATLEAALCRTPLVVVYRLSSAMVAEARILQALGLFRMPKYIALPNILLDEQAVPELIQDDASPAAIREWVDRLLHDSDLREAQQQCFERLDEALGAGDAITRTARLAAEMLA
jgi:lipid-A-disaccharide synthase